MTKFFKTISKSENYLTYYLRKGITMTYGGIELLVKEKSNTLYWQGWWIGLEGLTRKSSYICCLSFVFIRLEGRIRTSSASNLNTISRAQVFPNFSFTNTSLLCSRHQKPLHHKLDSLIYIDISTHMKGLGFYEKWCVLIFIF